MPNIRQAESAMYKGEAIFNARKRRWLRSFLEPIIRQREFMDLLLQATPEMLDELQKTSPNVLAEAMRIVNEQQMQGGNNGTTI